MTAPLAPSLHPLRKRVLRLTELSSVFEKAHELMEQTPGLSLERAMVQVQVPAIAQAQLAQRAQVDIDYVKNIMEAVTPMLEAIGEGAIALMRVFQDLWDQMEAISSKPQCPSHQCTLRGGRCPRCDRSHE